jgi:hypothetical protein
MTEETDLNELWLDLLDCIEEIGLDVRGNRRATRHVKILRQIVNQIGIELKNMASKGKRRFL